MKQNKKKLLGIGVSAVLLLTAVLRIFYVNAFAYQFPEQVYPMGEWVPLDGDFFFSEDEGTENYSVRVSSAEALPYAKFMERFGKEKDYLAEDSQHDVILLKVDFKNAGPEQGGVFIRDFNILNEYRSTLYNTSADYMKIANPNFNPNQWGLSVRPNTEASLWFVYTTVARADLITLLDEQDKKETLKMFLNVSLYPTKKTIELDIDISSL